MKILQYRFVEYIPDKLEDGILYISMEFSTAIHLCVCGCRNQVVTPLSPTGWKLIFDGETISLDPSIGNWSFDCKSHYWIKNNKIKHSSKWSQTKVNKVREEEYFKKKSYFGKTSKK